MQWSVTNGDCLELLKSLPSGSVDAVVTDPPYGMSLTPQRERTKAILNDGRDEAKALWRAMLPEFNRVLKDDTALIVFSRWSEVWSKEALEEHFTVKGCIVWKKNMFGIGYYLRPQWEMAWYCHKGTPPTPAEAQSDVWECDRVHNPKHSCEKPVELMMRAVEFVCPDGGTVLDPFCGLGATGSGCVMSGRNFIGYEIDPKYCEIARRRIEAAVPLFAEATNA